MVTVPVREQSARRFLGIAATLGVLGVDFNLNGGDDDSTLPKVMAALGILALIWSIHRFGRLGPDEMIVYEEPEADPAPKKKKKKRKVAADEASSNDGM